MKKFTKEEIQKLYHDFSYTTKEVAEILQINLKTLNTWIHKYDIKLRAEIKTKHLPKCAYCDKETFWKKYCSYDCRVKDKTKLVCDKEELYNMYIINKMNIFDIADKYQCAITTVRNNLKWYKIKFESNRDDYTNRIINKTLIKKKTKHPKSNNTNLYECVCGCGNIFIIPTSKLFSTSVKCEKCNTRKKRDTCELKNTYWQDIICRCQRNPNKIIPINITKEYAYQLFLSQNKKCKITGIPIQFAKTCLQHNKGYTTASLDRIDSSKGYIIGNVQWVHKWVNIMKQDMKPEEFLGWCELVCKQAKLDKKKGMSKKELLKS